MVFEGDFVAGIIRAVTPAVPGVNADVFPFPALGPPGPAVVAGGDAAVLMRRSAAGEALIRYLASPQAAAIWAAAGGFVSPNVNVGLAVYPDAISRFIAASLLQAGDNFRFSRLERDAGLGLRRDRGAGDAEEPAAVPGQPRCQRHGRAAGAGSGKGLPAMTGRPGQNRPNGMQVSAWPRQEAMAFQPAARFSHDPVPVYLDTPVHEQQRPGGQLRRDRVHRLAQPLSVTRQHTAPDHWHDVLGRGRWRSSDRRTRSPAARLPSVVSSTATSTTPSRSAVTRCVSVPNGRNPAKPSP